MTKKQISKAIGILSMNLLLMLGTAVISAIGVIATGAIYSGSMVWV